MIEKIEKKSLDAQTWMQEHGKNVSCEPLYQCPLPPHLFDCTLSFQIIRKREKIAFHNKYRNVKSRRRKKAKWRRSRTKCDSVSNMISVNISKIYTFMPNKQARNIDCLAVSRQRCMIFKMNKKCIAFLFAVWNSASVLCTEIRIVSSSNAVWYEVFSIFIWDFSGKIKRKYHFLMQNIFCSQHGLFYYMNNKYTKIQVSYSVWTKCCERILHLKRCCFVVDNFTISELKCLLKFPFTLIFKCWKRTSWSESLSKYIHTHTLFTLFISLSICCCWNSLRHNLLVFFTWLKAGFRYNFILYSFSSSVSQKEIVWLFFICWNVLHRLRWIFEYYMYIYLYRVLKTTAKNMLECRACQGLKCMYIGYLIHTFFVLHTFLSIATSCGTRFTVEIYCILWKSILEVRVGGRAVCVAQVLL